ncbi:MAG TPA: hypothetical protein VKU00_23650, partial [Chthonomonadaceae bacterium]|nr:hypothetical protein [Chthonomonadaceae bacterium]
MLISLLLLLTLARISGAQREAATAPPPAVEIPGGRTALDEIGIYRVTYRYRDGRSAAMPLGWTGHFEDATGISCTPFGTQAGKSVFLLHPPWRGGTGVTDQVLRLTLPKATRLNLHFGIAMKEGEVGPGKSDGAQFQVSLDNRVLMKRLKTDAVWTMFDFDLTPYAGQTVTLDFQTDPGPRDDPSFDYAFWGNREIVAEGTPRATSNYVPARLLPTARMLRSAWGGAAPNVPAPSEQNVRLTLKPGENHAAFPCDLSATLTVPASGKSAAWSSPAFGLGFGGYLELVGSDGKIVRSDSAQVKATATDRSLEGGSVRERTLRYQVGGRLITVTARVSTHPGDCIKLEVRSDAPYVAGIHFGEIGPAAFRRAL